MVSPGEVPDTFTSGELQKEQSLDNGNHTIQQTDDTGNQKSQNPEEVTPIKSEKPIQDPGSGLHISQLDKERSISSTTLGKVTFSSAFQSGRSPIIREKVSEDGYHWRKYGQKLVKGNEFIRSYYKCTHPSCLVKKQLERSHDGKISDIVYFGHHDHPKPEPNHPQAACLVLAVVEEKTDEPLSIVKEEACSPRKPKSSTTSQISTVTSIEDVKNVLPGSNEIDNDKVVPSKRQKKDNRNIEDKPTTIEPRVVVQTLSEVDIVNDGYRWRKYGQKMVKGNPNPRSYYRCSSPGCPVKKHVERASHDPKVVITSYEGQHDHNIPLSRTITQNPSGLNITTSHNGDLGSKPEATDESADKSSSPNEKTQKKRPDSSLMLSKPEDGGMCGSGSDALSNEIEDGSLILQVKSDKENGGELRAEVKGNRIACSAQTITPVLESSQNEQLVTSAELIQS